MEYFTLSRLQITGRIDDDTPTCVLIEIAQAHGIPFNLGHLGTNSYRTDLIQRIESTRLVAIREPYDKAHYRYIARFINSSTQWNKEQLNRALAFLRRYCSGSELPDPNFTVGQQTGDDPCSLNACVLYKLCRRNSIQTFRGTTIQYMATAIRLLLQPIPFLQQLLITRIEGLNRAELASTLVQLPRGEEIQVYSPIFSSSLGNMNHELLGNMNRELLGNMNHELLGNMNRELLGDLSESQREIITHSEVDHAYRNIGTGIELYARIEPRSDSEAIALSALVYKIDLSKFSSPKREYLELGRQPYIPTENSIRRIVTKNPSFLRLDLNFNPIIPVNLYNTDDLRKMAQNEGFQNSDILGSEYYELLQLAFLSNTFYHGLQDQLENTRTPISYDEIDELDNNAIICYGSRGSGKLTLFRYEELADSFRINKNFVHPIQTNVHLDPIAIRKLKRLSLEIYPNEDPETTEERRRLHSSIISTEIFTEENNARLRELWSLYTDSEDDIKISIRRCLTLILEMGMYMRGWSGAGDYPVIQAPYPNQEEVEIKVSDSIRRFEESCLELGDIGDLIKGLPLLTYRDGFVASTDNNQGITLHDRIEIVKEGDTSNNIYSCIRMSSNWICYSAYRYMQVIGMRPAFAVEQLRSIT